MSTDGPESLLPKKLDHCLRMLSKIYAHKGERQLAEILVNADTTIEVCGIDSSKNDIEIIDHELHLVLPESIFVKNVSNREKIQHRIKSDLNDLHNIRGEFFEHVFLEMESDNTTDWKRSSGLLHLSKNAVPTNIAKRIWGNEGFRLFLSHRADVKVQTARLKTTLRAYGISGFVAHADIGRSEAWEDEIKNALWTMNGLAALITEDFHESEWTDQEVGFALARGVPIIPLNLGGGPYGFMARLQAAPCSWERAPTEIVGVLSRRHPAILNSYLEAVRNCQSLSEGNVLADVLPHLDELTDEQADSLVSAYNKNDKIFDSFGFSGRKPAYGAGLLVHLRRTNGRKYQVMTSGKLKVET